MSARHLVFVLGFAFGGVPRPGSGADKPAKTEAQSPASKTSTDRNAERERRGEFLREELKRHVLVAADHPDRPLATTDKPLLRWSNPVRNFFSDGAVFLWLDSKRPVAVAVPSVRGNGGVAHEFSSLCGGPLECRRDGRVIWTPRQANLARQLLTGSRPTNRRNAGYGNYATSAADFERPRGATAPLNCAS